MCFDHCTGHDERTEAPPPGGDARTQLAEALNDVGLGCEEWSPADDNSGCPDCMDLMRRVDALLPVVQRIADERAAEALDKTADKWQWSAWADAPRIPGDVVAERIATAQYVTGWLRTRAASLRAASRGETAREHCTSTSCAARGCEAPGPNPPCGGYPR